MHLYETHLNMECTLNLLMLGVLTCTKFIYFNFSGCKYKY